MTTIKVKLDERKVVLARVGNIDREELIIKVDGDLEIPEDWKQGRILNDKVKVNYKKEGDIDFIGDFNWQASVHKGWLQNNVVLAGNGRGKAVMEPRPVIGSVGYRIGGIVTLGVLITIAVGLIWGLATGKIRMTFKKVQPKTDINSPLNNWGISDKQS